MAKTTVLRHGERHRTDRIGWLRAAVRGANDGIVSTASLVMGVAASGATHSSLLITGAAGLVAGARRVAFWGALAMGMTAALGAMFGVAA